jgi:hypothetical protein
MTSSELNRQLRLAHTTEPVKNIDLLAAVSRLRQEFLFEFCHLGWPINECLHSRNAFEAEIRSDIYIQGRQLSLD